MNTHAPFAPGDIVAATPHDLAVSGGSVAKIDGMAVFLDKGLPGETLRARITDCKARFAKAVVMETLEASPDARPSFCTCGETCGGCAWTTLAYEAQLAWKERQVKETLRRIGGVSFSEDGAEYLPIIASPRQTGHRNKMEFAFGFAEGSPALGLRRRGSHEIVNIDECPVCAVNVRELLAVAREWMRDSKLAPWNGKTGFLQFLVVRCPDYAPNATQRILVECITAPGSAQALKSVAVFGERLVASSFATGFVHSIRRTATPVAYGEKIAFAIGEATVTEKINSIILEAPVQAFMQTNTAAATLFYEQIRTYADVQNASICDLYSGVGGIALYLAKNAASVRGIEAVKHAVKFAKGNAVSSNVDAVFVCGDAADELLRLSPAPDVVITDPPRAGMEQRLIDALLSKRPSRIIAAGCDAASLARDIAKLSAAYRVKSARAVDMFPHTPHVEIAVLLEAIA